MSKRAASPPHGALIKRSRSSTPPTTQITISSSNDERQKGLIRAVKRTSALDAPIISLSGAHSVIEMFPFVQVYCERVLTTYDRPRF
jgi:Prp8 binding protein